MNARPRQRAGGWSLVELSVVLAVIGVIGLALWRVLPLAPQVVANDIAARELAQAEQALLGYALAHSRLPAADAAGRLPVSELGLPTRMRLHYIVQPALTSTPGNLFDPMLPPVVGQSAPTRSNLINGLDFCIALKQVQVVNSTLPGMRDVPTAFALMHTGPAGHEQTSAAFVLPGSADVGSRQVLAIGPGELASRLSCPDRVSRVHGASRASYAAYDLALVAQEYLAFRTFAIQVAKMNKSNADVGRDFAIFDVVFGVFLETVAILQEAAGWPPDALGIATGIASHVAATAQLVIAGINLDAAIKDVTSAEEDLVTAEEQKAAAATNLLRMQSLASQSLTQAQNLDRNGLTP